MAKCKVPAGVSKEQAVAMLHDTEFFISCDPCLDRYDLLEKEMANPELPDRIKALGPTSLYKIIDIVENVPKGIWGSSVESKYEFTQVEHGLFCRLRSPLSVVLEALWEVRDAEDGDGLEIVEEAEITASKMLVGIVKSQSEAGGKSWGHLSRLRLLSID